MASFKKRRHVLKSFLSGEAYFSGCGHCKAAKPEFTNAAEQFKDDNKVQLELLSA